VGLASWPWAPAEPSSDGGEQEVEAGGVGELEEEVDEEDEVDEIVEVRGRLEGEPSRESGSGESCSGEALPEGAALRSRLLI
jgi:hypothetical protein